MEDESLYPSLMSHGDESIQALAKRFSDEMGFIAEAALNYNEQWQSARLIQADPAQFISDTNSLFAVLGKRIEKENIQLYSALDKLE